MPWMCWAMPRRYLNRDFSDSDNLGSGVIPKRGWKSKLSPPSIQIIWRGNVFRDLLICDLLVRVRKVIDSRRASKWLAKELSKE